MWGRTGGGFSMAIPRGEQGREKGERQGEGNREQQDCSARLFEVDDVHDH